MADTSDDIPLWFIVGAALIFPFLFVFGALILGGRQARAMGRGTVTGDRSHLVTTVKRPS